MKILQSVLSIFCALQAILASDMFTSSLQIQKLLDSERSLLAFLEECFTKYSQQNAAYGRALISVKSDLISLPVTSSAEHPLDAVVGLNRFLGYVDRYLKMLPSDLIRKVEESYRKIGLTLPSSSTLDGSQLGLLRLQSTYKLTPGVLIGSSSINVTSRDCVSMATMAQKAGLKRLSSDWLAIAVDVANLSKEEHKSRSTADGCRRQFQQEQGKESKNGSRWNDDEMFQYLCSRYMNEASLGSLSKSSTCHYGRGSGPLKRWKVEELNGDPRVVLYHDVISDREADIFIHLGASMLERATTGDSPTKPNLHHLRTSKLSWLWDNHTAVVDRLSHRVAEITGLPTTFRDTATFAEPFQVVNYGIGGHYAPHYDYYVNPAVLETSTGFTKDSGDRLATFMFYLSEVGSGGGTVFPDLGVGAPPIKNAALFWYNFRPDGVRDARTRHGGCPVLCGHKWVANKWIREISGAMTSQCPATSPG